jgi:PadR family transcriptional regulator PadR
MSNSTELLQGTLDLLVLAHACTRSNARMERCAEYSGGIKGCVTGWAGIALSGVAPAGVQGLDSTWGTSENNRRAKSYASTARGRKELEAELKTWERLSMTIVLVLSPAATA